MITGQKLTKIFKSQGLTFFTGVPCSILKDFLNFIIENKQFKHIIANEEGEACAIASGYYLATKKIPVIYMQNSGLGNSVDALTSLTNKEMYRIPALFLISWRGEPGIKDEPQHMKMGKITKDLLKILGIPLAVLPEKEKEIEREIKKAKTYLEKESLPYALIIRKGTLAPYQAKTKEEGCLLTRERAIEIIVDNLKGNEVIVSTTGKTSRELFELRTNKKQSSQTDFYTLGSMGCAASIALAIALEKPKKKIFVFDGDGSVLMKMGALATIGHYLPKNFYHIIFDNGSYESTGGQKTVSDTADFSKIAKACGYDKARMVVKESELKKSLINLKKGPAMLVVKVKKGSRENLARPDKTPIENKETFMNFLVNKK